MSPIGASWSRDPDIDVVDINAPSDAHKEIALAAAKAGKHLFCEKPLALTLADSREMLDAAEDSWREAHGRL